MDKKYKDYLLNSIFDFFQYPEKTDRFILNKIMDSIEYNGNDIIFNRNRFDIDVDDKDKKILGFFLANLPLFIVGNRSKRDDLTPKLTKLQNDTYELINLNKFNEIATLEMYLLLEMGLRCSYSKWLGEKIVISKYGENDIILNNYDYRRLKLYIRLNKIGYYDITVNGEPFPNSENSLLHWAEKYLDKNSSLLFRLALNVRNLLAHGENEWDLYPVKYSVDSASFTVGKLMDRCTVNKNIYNKKYKN